MSSWQIVETLSFLRTNNPINYYRKLFLIYIFILKLISRTYTFRCIECHEGKETDLTTDHVKEMQIECTLSDKNLKSMVTDGAIDADMGFALPGSSTEAQVKTEESEDIPKTKAMLADIKSTFSCLEMQPRKMSEANCLSSCTR
jgi:hypothetical protein